MEERRQYPRLNANVLWRSAGLWARLRRVADVSLGGVRVYSDEEVALGSRVEIELLVPGEARIEILARVVRVHALPPGGPASWDVALEFLAITDDARRRLAVWLTPPSDTPETPVDEQRGAEARAHGVRDMGALALLILGALLLAAAACRDAIAEPPGSPLLSRGKPVAGWSPLSFARVKNVNDGDPWTTWSAGKPTPERPAWVALDVGKGPTRVLLTWSAAGSFDYEETDYGSPGAYRIETSADSTDGADGTWKQVLRVAPVLTHGAAHGLDFTGQRWVKVVVTGAPAESPNGVQLDEIEVRDASAGADLWFFMGDSITAFAFGRPPPREPGFAARIHERDPRRFPAVINGGTGGETSADGVRRIDAFLARSPDAHTWVIAYGTNDAAGDAADPSRFKANLGTVIDRVRAAGCVPILQTIPFASDGHHRFIPRFNEAIDDLRRTRSLPRGPDLYAWFEAHPEELRDGVHPDDRGIASINRLWAEAMDTKVARW